MENNLSDLDLVPVMDFPAPDTGALLAEDEDREAQGLAPRFAVPNATFITPDTHGRWQDLGDGTLMWRLRISSPGVESINLGFTSYYMPRGGSLWLYSSDLKDILPRPFGPEENQPHGELWTPVIQSDDIVVEVTLPEQDVSRLRLELTAVNLGYRGFGAAGDKQGACNVDVVCPEGDDWRDEIASVAVYSTGGYLFCTGFMVNNTAQDGTPYFQTAYHCGIRAGNASSLVVYWNYESPTCGALSGGSLTDYQTGATYLAGYSSSDFTLVELDDLPDSSWNVSYAGWDNSGTDATSAVGIHHPDTDEKAISFEYDPTTTTSYFGNNSPGDASHVRIEDWDEGTTESGSSGSPLFNQDHRVIGQLHGGYASCSNDLSDWYGNFSASWDGGGSSSSRLRDWLDPTGSGVSHLDTYSPWNSGGIDVSPDSDMESEGPVGGPFSPDSVTYFVENTDSSSLDLEVTTNRSWLEVDRSSTTISAGSTVAVTVSLAAEALSLGAGSYSGTVYFNNLSTGEGDATRTVSLTVGSDELIYEWDLDTDPGWSTQGDWAWGVPQGQSGTRGAPDPTSGYTGSKVYGYNLSGGYSSDMEEKHLISEAFDCSDLSGVTLGFWRWLGVETSKYDHASISVSRDRSNWTTVWENSDTLDDGEWTWQEYDISSVADGEPTVFLRWTMGSTDRSVEYCGWNIDDIQIWAVESCGDADSDSYQDATCGGDDCDDSQPSVNPGAQERCSDGTDNDCDGLIDAQDPDCSDTGNPGGPGDTGSYGAPGTLDTGSSKGSTNCQGCNPVSGGPAGGLLALLIGAWLAMRRRAVA